MARENKVETFISFYPAALQKALVDKPDDYAFTVEQIPGVVSRMRQALISGSYNHDGRAIKQVCKSLGIKHTRKAMEEFFNS